MNIKQFLNTKVEAGKKVDVKEVAAKTGKALLVGAKAITPASIRYVERVENDALDRDIEMTGDLQVVLESLNELRRLAGLPETQLMSQEESAEYVAEVRWQMDEYKALAKAEKKRTRDEKMETTREAIGNKLMELLNGKRKDPNPVPAQAQGDSPYEDEDEAAPTVQSTEDINAFIEARIAQEHEKKTTRKLPDVFDAPDNKYNFSDMAE